MEITIILPSSLGYAGASGPLWVDSDTKKCSRLETANVVNTDQSDLIADLEND